MNKWSSTNVVEWMAALNLAPYTEIFKSKDIKGSDLICLDKDKLGVSIWTCAKCIFEELVNLKSFF